MSRAYAGKLKLLYGSQEALNTSECMYFLIDDKRLHQQKCPMHWQDTQPCRRQAQHDNAPVATCLFRVLSTACVRLLTVACHSRNSPSGSCRCHHTTCLLPALTCAGVRAPFLTLCHSAAMPGRVAAKELHTHTLCPLQKGQPRASWARLRTNACHSWGC